MHAALGAKPAVGPAAVDAERHALEAGLLALRLVEDLRGEVVSLGPAEEHAEEHLRPVGRLRPAGTRADRDQRAALVVLPREEQRRALALERDPEGLGVTVDLGEHLGIVGLGGEV